MSMLIFLPDDSFHDAWGKKQLVIEVKMQNEASDFENV